jgi:hypothetical protein
MTACGLVGVRVAGGLVGCAVTGGLVGRLVAVGRISGVAVSVGGGRRISVGADITVTAGAGGSWMGVGRLVEEQLASPDNDKMLTPKIKKLVRRFIKLRYLPAGIGLSGHWPPKPLHAAQDPSFLTAWIGFPRRRSGWPG